MADALARPGKSHDDEERLARARVGSADMGYQSQIYDRGWVSLACFGKLWRARSLLYQRRFLRPNTHFSAFFEIYKIDIPLHRLNVKISAKFCKTFSHFFVNFLKNRYFRVVFVDFFTDFDEIFPEFRQIS